MFFCQKTPVFLVEKKRGGRGRGVRSPPERPTPLRTSGKEGSLWLKIPRTQLSGITDIQPVGMTAHEMKVGKNMLIAYLLS